MKILLLNQVFYPDSVATAQHSTDLALYLKEQGHEVSVVCGRRGYEDRSKVFPARENYKGIEIYRAHSTGFGKKSFLHRLVDALTFDAALAWTLLRVPPQDVVLSMTSPPLIALFGILFCRVKGGRLAQWLMDLNPDSAIAVGYLKKGSWIANTLVTIFRYTLKKSDLMIVLDRWKKRTIVRHGGREEDIVVIPPWPVHAIDAEKRREPKSDNAFRRQYGLEKKFVVLYSGNHSIVHPVKTLLDAAALLKNDPSVVFAFIGGGLRVREVTEFKEANGLRNILQLPSQPRELLGSSLTAADLHVVIMGEEVSGLVHASKIYGVLGTGCPYVAIAPEESHLADVIAECPFGWRVDHGEAAKFVEVIQKVRALSADKLDEIHVNNLKHVVTHYSAPVILRRYGQALDRLTPTYVEAPRRAVAK